MRTGLRAPIRVGWVWEGMGFPSQSFQSWRLQKKTPRMGCLRISFPEFRLKAKIPRLAAGERAPRRLRRGCEPGFCVPAAHRDGPLRRYRFQKEQHPVGVLFFLEAPPGIGPGNRGFAVRCLTAWLWRHICDLLLSEQIAFVWSGLRGSNSLPPPWQGGALPDELCPHTEHD